MKLTPAASVIPVCASVAELLHDLALAPLLVLEAVLELALLLTLALVFVPMLALVLMPEVALVLVLIPVLAHSLVLTLEHVPSEDISFLNFERNINALNSSKSSFPLPSRSLLWNGFFFN